MSDIEQVDREFRAALGPALFGTLGVFVLIQLVGLYHAGWRFEYPLDDVYIHLAMGEQLARGGYGVNAGENASASSSILYTFMLAPFAGTEFHRYLPLLWNALAVVASGVFWAMLVARAIVAGLAAWTRALVAGLVPIFLNIAAVGFTGMEHGPHTAVSLMVLVGLVDLVTTGRVTWMVIAGVILAPLLRFEGLALALLACTAVWWAGHWRKAALLAMGAVVPVAAFVTALVMMGLEPLPSSVIVKLGLEEGDGGLGNPFDKLLFNLRHEPALALTATAALGFWAALISRRGNRRAASVIAMVIGGAALSHLVLGRFGWMDRYENYIIVVTAGAALWLAAQVGSRLSRTIMTAAVLALSLAFFPFYLRNYLVVSQYGALSVQLQQGEMARFAQAYVQGPVAVNDLGRVSYGNPDYVLDLWGLASPEARKRRLDRYREQGWPGDVVEAYGIDLVMIYDQFLPLAVHPDWVPLGTLKHLTHRGMLAHTEVAFYATSAAAAQSLREDLNEFVPTLPDGVAFEAAPGTEMEDADVAE